MADFDDPAYRQWEKKFYESIGASGQKTLLPTVSGEAAQNRMRGLYPDAPLEPIINSLREYYREPKNIVNTLLDFIPGVGDFKSGTEAVVGETATGEPLSWWERLISGAGALPLVPSAMGIMKGMKSEGKMSKALKETPKTPEGGIITKVVDAEGKPLKVYHGTRSEFEIEDFNTDFGAFFTPSREGAKSYTNPRESQRLLKHIKPGKGRILEAYLDIKKPFDLSAYGAEDHVFGPRDAFLGNQAASANKLRDLLGNPPDADLLAAIKKVGLKGKLLEALYHNDPALYALQEIFNLREVESFGGGRAHNIISGFKYKIIKKREVMHERVSKEVKTFLEGLGFDGIKFNDETVGSFGAQQEIPTYVVFSKDQIKKPLPNLTPPVGGK